MTHDRSDRGAGSGSIDPGLARRVEGLVDDAVALAARGGYRDAAARAQEALSLDPDNPDARDLLESYGRFAADDEERRRRRRSIAAAAATIEEMIEEEQLEEAATAVEALALQYGSEAPVDELRGRITEAQASGLDFDELDAAIDAIRRPAAQVDKAMQPARSLDAAGRLFAEIEDHLRFGRLEEASGRLGQLETMPDAESRVHKLRARIEEARQVAAEHRRDEEILIATAAIEDRIRHGSIDDAAERLAALAARHGSNAPVDELSARLEEARERTVAGAGVDAGRAGAERTAEFSGAARELTGPHGSEFTEEIEHAPAGSGRGRWMGIAAAAVVVAAGVGWWAFLRPEAVTAPAGTNETAAIVAPAEVAGVLDAATPGDSAEGSTQPGAPAAGEAGGAPALSPDSTGGEAAAAGARADAPSPAADAGAVDTEAPAPAGDALGPAESETVVARDLEQPPSSPAVDVADEAIGGEEGRSQPDLGASDPSLAEIASVTELPVPADGAAPATIPGSPAPDGTEPGATEEPSATETAGTQAAEGSSTSAPGQGQEPGAEVAADVAFEPLGAEPEPPSRPAGAAVATEAERPAASPDSARSAEANDAPAATRSEPEREARPTSSAVPAASAASNDSAVPAAAQRPSLVSDLLGCGDPGVVCVRPLNVPQPAYPAIARQRRLSATVVVRALVDETGKVVETRVESGSFRFFDDAAVDAASRAVFQPATRAGVPGQSWARLSFQFTPR